MGIAGIGSSRPDTSQVCSSDCSRPSLATPPYIVATQVGPPSIPGLGLRSFRDIMVAFRGWCSCGHCLISGHMGVPCSASSACSVFDFSANWLA